MKGILGRKAGMTTVFSEGGRAIPVTIIEVQKNTVLETKTIEKDGYIATKLGAFDKKEQRATKAELGSIKKANTSPKYFVKEIRNMDGYDRGSTLSASIFEPGEYVDVTGISKGKGFQGSIKRHNFSRGPMGHGSKYHRGSGSKGTMAEHVWKGKKSPGHMGNQKVTMQNLVLIDVDLDNNALLIKGSIPGPNKSFVVVRDSIKKEIDTTKITLVSVGEMKIKNELLEEAKKVGAEVNTKMSIRRMKELIAEASIQKENEQKEYEELLEKAKEIKISNPEKLSLDELKELVEKGEITKDTSKPNKKIKEEVQKEKVDAPIIDENNKELPKQEADKKEVPEENQSENKQEISNEKIDDSNKEEIKTEISNEVETEKKEVLEENQPENKQETLNEELDDFNKEESKQELEKKEIVNDSNEEETKIENSDEVEANKKEVSEENQSENKQETLNEKIDDSNKEESKQELEKKEIVNDSNEEETKEEKVEEVEEDQKEISEENQSENKQEKKEDK